MHATNFHSTGAADAAREAHCLSQEAERRTDYSPGLALGRKCAVTDGPQYEGYHSYSGWARYPTHVIPVAGDAKGVGNQQSLLIPEAILLNCVPQLSLMGITSITAVGVPQHN